MLATATDSEESDPFADVEEDEDELEDNEIVLGTANLFYYVCTYRVNLWYCHKVCSSAHVVLEY